MTMAAPSDMAIIPVLSKRERRQFIDFPKSLYKGNPGYVAPLDIERLEAIDSSRNPYFDHAEVALFLAQRGGKIVGRISAQLCSLMREKAGKPVGHFGFLDAIDDRAVFAALLKQAESWLKARGAVEILGPFSFSTNEECGQLVEGFSAQPMMMMPFHLPYQGAHVESLGYRKAKDLLAYVVGEESYRALGASELARKASESGRLSLRPADMRHLRRDLSLILDVFNDAWAENWGMVPFTKGEIEMAAKAMKPLIDPSLTVLAEVDGEIAGMLVCLPNLCEAVADLNGSLLPFGWAKLLWRLKCKRLKSARIPLMGVRRKYQGTILGAIMLPAMFERLRPSFLARGLKSVELSWILEDNLPMRRVLEGIGATIYKTYRIYEKSL